MKHRIFRDLVENLGFRVFAIENHWAAGEKADRYVQTCEGSPEEAADTHMHLWRSVELRDLVQWMCEWNQAHPTTGSTISASTPRMPASTARL